MAFVCPPKDSAEQQLKVIKNIKDIVENLEKSMTIGVKPICIPACIPIADYPKPAKSTTCCPPSCNVPVNSKREPPDVMVCYKVCSKEPRGKQDKHGKVTGSNPKFDYRTSKALELRSSFFILCGCKRRNGLQDFCPRMECNGSPDCTPFPPRCGPSKFDPTYVGITEEQKLLEINKMRKGQNSKKACFKCFPAVIEETAICN
ncbi:uncharacterized protein LOC130898013 isoform X2 [Diorhabda carinulata]|uniref:uncharacterized protein LOC130898013 isoform X2 n=1 Tax=Diorhabda carinulata TaxID=1163345 RepID=UPI0025A13067|nr:uncharacterized protein LOC130898013 isoform X2 [Diorhabda carinulata]